MSTKVTPIMLIYHSDMMILGAAWGKWGQRGIGTKMQFLSMIPQLLFECLYKRSIAIPRGHDHVSIKLKL